MRHQKTKQWLITIVATINLIALLWTSAGTAQAADRVHIVRPGEGLARIAQQYGLSMSYLAAYNGIINPNHVLIGQKLSIPYNTEQSLAATPADTTYLPGNDGYHTVTQGDMLSQIAKNNNIPLEELLRINGLQFQDTIYVGQQIRLTSRVDPATSYVEVAPALADTIYTVQPGDTLAMIALHHDMTLNELMVLNGLPNPNFVWVGQRLRVNLAPTPQETMTAAGAPTDGRRRIEINLTTQTLTAWQGGIPILHVLVSTGKASTPTVPGTFHIYNKLDSQHMTGPDYDLPGVPWVMYYYQGFAIHGAYWHANFGTPTSHGCTNMTLEDAEALYNWADVGTEVYVHY